MSRLVTLATILLAAAAVAAPVALADSPNFHFANASVSSSTGALEVNFKLSGLGNTVTSVDISLTASASATYQCFNNGGKHPKAGNKETVNGPLAGSGSFPVRNGSVTGTISAGPLDPGSFACPSGQTLFLEAVSYSAITVSTAEGGGASTLATPDSISLTGLHIPV
jgi:hypothetical protein